MLCITYTQIIIPQTLAKREMVKERIEKILDFPVREGYDKAIHYARKGEMT